MSGLDTLVDLARAAALGGAPARETLARALWPNAYRIAWSILGDTQAAEEAAQDACIAVCAALADLRQIDAFPAWAYRTVVSRARDRARRMRRDGERRAPLVDAPTIDATGASLDRLDLFAAIGTLPEWLRLPLELHYFIGLSSREVGQALGIPAPTVRFRLALARTRLRPLVEIRLNATHQTESMP